MYQRTSYQAYNNSPVVKTKAHTISALDTDSIEQAAQLCNQFQTICVELFFLQAVQHCIVYARAARRSRWRLPPRHPIEHPICRRIFCAPVVTRAVITIHRPAVWRRFLLHFASGPALPPQSVSPGVVENLPICRRRRWRRRRGRNAGQHGDSGKRRRHDILVTARLFSTGGCTWMRESDTWSSGDHAASCSCVMGRLCSTCRCSWMRARGILEWMFLPSSKPSPYGASRNRKTQRVRMKGCFCSGGSLRRFHLRRGV